MKIYNFVEWELDLFRSRCNFNQLERAVFERRAKDIPIEQIAEELGYSSDYIKRVSVRVNRKIVKSI